MLLMIVFCSMFLIHLKGNIRIFIVSICPDFLFPSEKYCQKLKKYAAIQKKKTKTNNITVILLFDYISAE